MEYVPAKTMLLPKNPRETLLGEEHAYTLNIYRGCSHGCIYCDSRSDCYRVADFGTVRAKTRALEIIEDELRRKRRAGIVNTGSMTDPYNPEERRERLTRGALELFKRYGFGASVITKSASVTRDIDLYQEIAAVAPCHVLMTVTTTDEQLCSKIEPHVSRTSERFAALNELHRAGIPTGIFLSPVLPYLTDTPEGMRDLLEQAAANGVRYIIGSFGMTLRNGNREYYYAALDRLFPGLKQQYIAMYGDRYSCRSPRSQELVRLFEAECDRWGILFRREAIRELLFSTWGRQQLALL